MEGKVAARGKEELEGQEARAELEVLEVLEELKEKEERVAWE